MPRADSGYSGRDSDYGSSRGRISNMWTKFRRSPRRTAQRTTKHRGDDSVLEYIRGRHPPPGKGIMPAKPSTDGVSKAEMTPEEGIVRVGGADAQEMTPEEVRLFEEDLEDTLRGERIPFLPPAQAESKLSAADLLTAFLNSAQSDTKMRLHGLDYLFGNGDRINSVVIPGIKDLLDLQLAKIPLKDLLSDEMCQAISDRVAVASKSLAAKSRSLVTALLQQSLNAFDIRDNLNELAKKQDAVESKRLWNTNSKIKTIEDLGEYLEECFISKIKTILVAGVQSAGGKFAMKATILAVETAAAAAAAAANALNKSGETEQKTPLSEGAGGAAKEFQSLVALDDEVAREAKLKVIFKEEHVQNIQTYIASIKRNINNYLQRAAITETQGGGHRRTKKKTMKKKTMKKKTMKKKTMKKKTMKKKTMKKKTMKRKTMKRKTMKRKRRQYLKI